MPKPVPGRIPILIVDERAANRSALTALLSDLQAELELVEAPSGNEALRHSLKSDFAVVLLDVQMPGVDGMEVAALLRANPKTRHLPIIFVTAGMNQREHLFQGYESGTVDYLIKPIEPLVLRSKLKVFCELYAQRRELDHHRTHLEAMVAQRTAELAALAQHLREEIAERLRAQEELRQLNDSLEARVGERSVELRRALDQIVESEKLASLGSIVAGVAHELSTPIGNIVMTVSTLEERIVELAAAVHEGKLSRRALGIFVEECQNASAVLVRSAARASVLIESFKEIAVDQTSQRRRVFDLRDTLADILNTLGTVMRRARVSHELRVPPGIRMDSFPGDLEQVFSNLIMNSIRHGFAARGCGHIAIDASLRDEALEIVYRDDGSGIPPELHRKIFEPFYTTTLGQGGSGLGMFIVHKLMHGALKGEIRLDSAVGEGVVFTLTLPAVTP